MKINIKLLNNEAKLPTRATDGSACYDLGFTSLEINEPKQIITFHTGIAVEVPKGYVMKIYPRSSTFDRYILSQTNNVGIIDSDYRGEVLVKMHYKHADTRPRFGGDIKIAQFMVVRQGVKCDWVVVDELSETERGEGGFGSTG